MTLAIDSTEHGVVIEEKNEPKIRVEDRDSGIVIYSKDSLADRGDTVDVWIPGEFHSYRNDAFHQDAKESIEKFILTATQNSHLMERGGASEEALNKLRN
jgi:hypothetical protein